MVLLTTLGAAAAGLLGGALWFDALARSGVRAAGPTGEVFAEGLASAPAPLAVVAALLAALLMRDGYEALGVSAPLEGALWGAAAGAALMAPWALAAALAGRRAPWCADAGAAAAALAATGAVLTA